VTFGSPQELFGDDFLEDVGVVKVEACFSLEKVGCFSIEVVSLLDVLSNQMQVGLNDGSLTKLYLRG